MLVFRLSWRLMWRVYLAHRPSRTNIHWGWARNDGGAAGTPRHDDGGPMQGLPGAPFPGELPQSGDVRIVAMVSFVATPRLTPSP